ncbi:CHASE3 domain-containing protein [Deinococcus multiflagellatus]|nr:ATP-binding protein [Deinococcus multiflagellatus]MBZ9712318.1 CHASE3 domain-containing protein [Deinococcus multiflagellatus]
MSVPPSAPDRLAAHPADGARPALRDHLLRPLLTPFVLLLGVGAAVVYGVGRNDQALQRVLDAQARTQLISELTGQVAAMENGQRGFVITGQSRFLAPYQEAQASFQAAAYALHDLSVDEAQRLTLGQVQTLVGRWQQEAAQPEIQARLGSLQAAAGLVAQGRGRVILERARGVLAVLASQENARLSEATRQSQATLNAVRWVSVGGLLLGMALLVATATRVARTVGRHVQELNVAAQDMARGEYARRMPGSPVQELAVLGAQFDLMAQAVQEREQQLRRSAQALERSNEQLARSNRELEQFAYVASHDLQEPLRTIGSYTELLARRYAGQLDERADQYIAFTTAATQRLKTLIQDLLSYSRVRRTQRFFVPTDVGALVGGVLADLHAQIEAAGAQVEVGSLPTVTSHPELLRQALQNLISNALKFRAPDRPAQVRISAAQQEGRWVLSVQDNGIGIAPEYHERIFGVFQRLHSADAYPGSGIGLSVARAVAEALGAELRLSSAPDQGSTFSLALPVRPPADPSPEGTGV